MVQVSSEPWVKRSSSSNEGFRLERMEIYNWGTFNKRIWTIHPAGGSSLLTGANGSGKSTLVDALLTLLVPYQRRTYNLASGNDRHRERDERSYILGAWGKQKDLENNSARLQYLRQPEGYSVLLAEFTNPRLKQVVTLAQILWIDDTVRKLFLIAQRPLSIQEDFRLKGSPPDLRKHLKGQGIEVFDEFSKYSRRFRQLMNFRSEKALDLFNQIVSIKEIGGLNAFIREHMLEKSNAQERIQLLRDNFENLTRAHDAIQLAERQMEILTPLMQEAQRYADFQERIFEANTCGELVPLYIAQQKLSLLIQALQESRQQLARQTTRQERLQADLSELTQKIISLNVSLSSDNVGQQMKDLKREIEQLLLRVEERQRSAKKYDQLAKALNLPVYQDEEGFHTTRERAETLLQHAQQQREQLQTRRDELMQQMTPLREACQNLEKELRSLQQRNSQIPSQDISIREGLLAMLKVEEEHLPFVGELLRVRSSEQRWEPAIQRLLYNFGRQLLVSERYYQQVSQYVESTNLRGRLVYHRITTERAPRHGERLEANALYHKLEVKPDSIFTGWLSAELIDSYGYVCCETLEEFQRAHRALTRNGQLKHGQARHEKDDRYTLGDRTRYILGWSNKEKRLAIEEELAQKRVQLNKVQVAIQQLEQEQTSVQNTLASSQLLLAVDTFASIDWRTLAGMRQEKQQQLSDLEAQSAHLEHLSRQLKEAEEQQQEKQKEQRQVTGQISLLDNEIKNYMVQEQECQWLLSEQHRNMSGIFERIGKDVKDLERQRELTLQLSTIAEVQDRLRQLYQNRSVSLQNQASQASLKIINGMRDFLQTNPMMLQEMDASIDALGEYQRAYERIRGDDLPRHRKRFKELLNEKMITDIGSFKAALEQQESAIKTSIEHLNISLGKIGYTDATYIQLNGARTYDKEVREFHDLLRSCLPDVAQTRTPELNEISFQRIRGLLQRFEQDTRWTNKVADVRNWLDFSAVELYRENDQQKNFYSDSSGKSGGQKAKLAYTILASAIAYQYGLDQEEGRERTFRFVAVDEAFSKSDERNARYAMELFQQLDLQLLVITPLDKIHVVEPYISACHYVTNNEDENDSKVYNLTFAEYLAQKQAWKDEKGILE
jgi:uncharacterized protein YPO0396